MWKLFLPEDVEQLNELQHSGANCRQTGQVENFNEIMLFSVRVT